MDEEAVGVWLVPAKPKTRLASAAGEKKPAVRDVLRGSGGNDGLDDVVDEASNTKAGLRRLLVDVETEEFDDHECMVAGVAVVACRRWGVVSRLPLGGRFLTIPCVLSCNVDPAKGCCCCCGG